MPRATVLQYARYGGPEVLETAEVDLPEPNEGEVLVAVRAAGLNPFDAKSRSGRFGGGKPAPEAPVRVGFDLAGVVEAVGPGAGVQVGDEVLGLVAGPGGAMATHAIAGPVARKPEGTSVADAAAWPTVTEAATRALAAVGIPAPAASSGADDARGGDTLLVHGGGGSVGLLVVQLALRAGVHVVATAGPHDHESLNGLGAMPVRYGSGWVERVQAAAERIDAVVDVAGAGVLADSVALAGGPDRVVTLAGDDAEMTGVRFSGAGTPEGKAAAIAAIPGLMRDGVRLPVGGVFTWPDVVQAYADLDAGARGKLVVTLPA